MKLLFKTFIFLLLLHYVNGQCDTGELYDGQKCYQFVKTPMKFDDALQYCKNQSYDLPSIHNAFDNAYMAREVGIEFSMTVSSYYIGMNKAGTGVWGWSDGSKYDYKNWIPGEPSGINQCAVQRTSDGQWLTYSCVNSLPFVCVGVPHTTTRNPIQPTTQYHKRCGKETRSYAKKTMNTSVQAPNCDVGYTYFDGTAMCYKIEVIDYDRGWKDCPAGAIHSEEEDCFVKDLAVDFMILNNCLPDWDDWEYYFYWIQAMVPLEDGTCIWLAEGKIADYGNSPFWPWNCSNHSPWGHTDAFAIVDKTDLSVLWQRTVDYHDAPLNCRTGMCKKPPL